MTQPAPLPLESEHPLHPPGRLAELTHQFGVAPLLYPSGEMGWLVTRHADVRAVLADPGTFSSENRWRFFDPTRPVPPDDPGRTSPAGMFISDDPPAHGFYRGKLARHFTRRRMKDLEPRIHEIVDRQLDQMARAGQPADVVQAFALPVPTLVICELLGVPYADRSVFQQAAATLFSLVSDPEDVRAASSALRDFMRALLRDKRRNMDGALLSELIADDRGDRPLTEDEAVNVGLLLLVAGHESTVNTLALGILALLREPEQLRRLRADLSLMDTAVEEILRFLPVTRIGLVRIATRNTVLGGQQITAGQPVIASIVAANRDPRAFGDPDRLDITRAGPQHTAFGHGVHLCIGHQLARIQLRTAFRGFFERFPGAELAVPLERVRFRTDREIYGVHNLPVTW